MFCGVNPLAEFVLKQNAAVRAVAAEQREDAPDWPAWADAVCDAVERIAKLHANDDPCRDAREGGCETLRLLATIYADSAEYRDGWRPDTRGQYGPSAD